MARRLSPPGPKQSAHIRDLASLGQLVRHRRLELALRIDDAAHACGVTASVLSRLENGAAVGADRLLLVIGGLGLSLLVTSKQEAQAITSSMQAEFDAAASAPDGRAPGEDA